MIDKIMWADNEVKNTRLKNKYRTAVTTDEGTNQVAAFPSTRAEFTARHVGHVKVKNIKAVLELLVFTLQTH